MSWRARLRSLFSNLLRRSRVERDLDDEVRSYTEMAADENVHAGMSRAEARRAALLEVGGVEQVKEQVREIRTGMLLQTMMQDLRYAVRMLRRNPAFSLAAILALALGIGANTAIFSIVDGVLLRPLPFPNADRLGVVSMRFTPQNMARGPLSVADYLDWKDANRAFEAHAIFSNGRIDLTGVDQPESIVGVFVTPGFFPVLGVRPLHGRSFLPGEETPNGRRLLILSEALWRRRFHADPAVVGQVVNGNGLPYTIVGVMPASFTYPRANVEFWSNFWLAPATRRGPFMLSAIGRLAPAATFEQAQREADIVAARIERGEPQTYSGLSMPVDPLRDSLVRDTRTSLLVMFAAVGCVLLIAMVNVANLLLVRASTREREIAVRLALGAGRGRLMRQLLTESILLAAIGGAAGVGLAFLGLDALRATNAANIPRFEDVRLDLRVLMFTALVSIAAGTIFGLAPALRSGRMSLTRSLREGDRAATSGRPQRRTHDALVVVEVALSLMLLVGAGLLVRSFFRLQQVDIGLGAPAAEVVTMRVSPSQVRFNPPGGRPDFDGARAYFDQLLATLRRVPGVEAVTLAEAVPPNRFSWSDSFVLEGQSLEEARQNPSVVIPTVGNDYFRALGIPLIAGRTFDERDKGDSTPVTVISQNMARRYFAGRDPIGARIKLSGPGLPNNPKLEVIGIVGDVTYSGLQDEARPVYYRAFAQAFSLRNYLIVRSPLGAAIVPQLRKEFQAFDKDIVVAQVSTMESAVADSIAEPRFRMLLLAGFAAVALILAATGIYGVMAYAVAQRTHELGLRLALGADRYDVLRLVVGKAASLSILGIALGTTGALLLTRWMSTMLFRVEPRDPMTFVAVATALAGIALAASVLPSRRALRIDPMVALRHD
jgi:predicted permease